MNHPRSDIRRKAQQQGIHQTIPPCAVVVLWLLTQALTKDMSRRRHRWIVCSLIIRLFESKPATGHPGLLLLLLLMLLNLLQC